MPTLLLKLKHVPEDEHAEICELLESNQIAYYETNVGFWGVGMAGIWLNDSDQLDQAQSLLQKYMEQRQVKAREAYEQAIADGTARTLFSTFRQQPVMFILYVIIIGFVIGLTTLPFLGLL